MILRSTLSAALCASVLALGCQPADSKTDGATTTTTTTTPTKKDPAVPAPGDIPAPADVAAPPADAEKTPSGLASKVLSPGKGTQKPTAEDTVEVHYSGWTTDGKMFDSSVKRGRTASFPLGAVIAGWTEGLQLMVEGEKVYTALANVQPAPLEDFPHLIEVLEAEAAKMRKIDEENMAAIARMMGETA